MIDEDKLNALELFGENEYLHKEIERLNKELKQEKKDFKEANDKCFKLISENKRLNNIINGLEKYINEEYIYDELGMKIFDASKLQDKLQELKGEDKK